MRCGIGSWGGRRPSLAGYVTGTGPQSRAPAAGEPFMSPILYPPEYPSRKDFLEDYRRRTVWVPRYDRVVPRGAGPVRRPARG